MTLIRVSLAFPYAHSLTAMPTEPTMTSVANSWSAPVNAVSGRLRVEFEDLKPGLRHAVYLELLNRSAGPIAVTNQPEVHARLFDSAGRPSNAAGSSRSGPVPDPQWAVIPSAAYIGFRIDMQTVGVPTRGQGIALIALGGKSWELRAGTYVLSTAAAFKRAEDGPPSQWVGELQLPPVEFAVTMQMLAAN
jgi:hypothetical protein